MNIQNIVISAVAVVALVLGGLAYTKNTASPAPTQQFGSITGPVISYPYLRVGGASVYDTGEQLRAATSTLCDIASPPATSTLQDAQINFLTSSSSALVVQIGKGTNTGTIATQIGTNYNIAAGAQATIQASSTPGAAGQVMTFAPNTQLLFETTLGGAQDAETGACQAEFIASN